MNININLRMKSSSNSTLIMATQVLINTRNRKVNASFRQSWISIIKCALSKVILKRIKTFKTHCSNVSLFQRLHKWPNAYTLRLLGFRYFPSLQKGSSIAKTLVIRVIISVASISHHRVMSLFWGLSWILSGISLNLRLLYELAYSLYHFVSQPRPFLYFLFTSKLSTAVRSITHDMTWHDMTWHDIMSLLWWWPSARNVSISITFKFPNHLLPILHSLQSHNADASNCFSISKQLSRTFDCHTNLYGLLNWSDSMTQWTVAAASAG